MTERTEPLQAALRHTGSRAEQQAAELVARLRAGEVPAYTRLRHRICKNCRESNRCSGPACDRAGRIPLSSEDVVRLLAFAGHEGARLLAPRTFRGWEDLPGACDTVDEYALLDAKPLDQWLTALRRLARLLPSAPDGRSAEEFLLCVAVGEAEEFTRIRPCDVLLDEHVRLLTVRYQYKAREATQRAVLRCLLGDA